MNLLALDYQTKIDNMEDSKSDSEEGLENIKLDIHEENQLLSPEDEKSIIREIIDESKEAKEESDILPTEMVDLILDKDENLTSRWNIDRIAGLLTYLADSDPPQIQTSGPENTMATSVIKNDVNFCSTGENRESDCLDKDFKDKIKFQTLGPYLSMDKVPKNSIDFKQRASPDQPRMNADNRLKTQRTKAGNPHLEDFLLDLLERQSYISYIHWINKERKEFKLANRRQLANLWGQKRGKKKFTEDKLLREMRNLCNKKKVEKTQRRDHFRFLI